MLKTLIAATLFTLTASAQEVDLPRPDLEILSVRFTNGTIARVQVLGFDGERMKLREVVLDGSMEVRHQLSEFEPSSAFRIELAARNPSSYEEHFAMARKAAGLGLCEAAGEQAAAALMHLEGNPDAEALSLELRGWSADSLEGWLRDSLEARDLSRASHYLKLLAIRYSDLRTEEQLDGLAALVETLERDRAAKRQADRLARLDKQRLADIEKHLKPIRREIDNGDKLYRSAIAKSRQMTQSAKLAASAIEAYRSGWMSTLALQKRHPDDHSLVVELESIANHVHDHAMMAALHAANLMTVRGDYVGAMEWVRRVLAMDPENAEAKELQRTIAVAGAASLGGWGWGWGTRDL